MPRSEKALIERIRLQARRFGPIVKTGIGDDCAVLRTPPDHEVLVTTDFSLEGIHFRREWHPPESVGHRCLTRGLSDIAAMGGDPVAAFLSLALPKAISQRWVDRFTRGLLDLAQAANVTLAGGDTAQSPSGIFADIIVLGFVPRGRAILRSTARPGDRICVTGELGSSAAALDQLLSSRKKKLTPQNYPRHFFPQPRVEVGRALREKKLASAMIDLSDGLSTDLRHICDESGVGAEIFSPALPVGADPDKNRTAALNFALHGGDDYELLFTAPAKKTLPSTIAGIQITEIGVVTRGKGIFLVNSSGRKTKLHAKGWQHFSQGR